MESSTPSSETTPANEYKDEIEIMHYAVWKNWSAGYMYMACVSPGKFYEDASIDPAKDHGISRNRGDVNCPDCLRMMGAS